MYEKKIPQKRDSRVPLKLHCFGRGITGIRMIPMRVYTLETDAALQAHPHLDIGLLVGVSGMVVE